MSDTPIQGSTTADKYTHLPLDAQHIVRKLQRENAALKQRIIDDNKAYGCEIREPSGTIWDHAQKLQKENAALLDLIEDMARQHCHTGVALRDYNGQVAGSMVTDSGALTVNAESLRLLAQTKPPRFRIVAEGGRMVVGYWPENDPQKEAQP